MIAPQKDWLGLLGARHLVGSSAQGLLALPVLWNGTPPRQGRRRSRRRAAGSFGAGRNSSGAAR